MPRPQRHDESVALFPVKRLTVNHRCAAAAEGMIDAGAVMAVNLGLLAGAEHLQPAGKRWKGRAARDRVHIFERDAVIRVGIARGQTLKRKITIRPTVVKKRRALMAGLPDGSSHAVTNCWINRFVDRQPPLAIGLKRDRVQRL